MGLLDLVVLFVAFLRLHHTVFHSDCTIYIPTSTTQGSFFFTTSFSSVQFSSVQLLSCVRFFVIPWTAVYQASLSITNSQNSLKLMSIESVMSSNHLILIVIPFFSHLQSFPASGSFSMSQFFASGGQVLEFQLQHQSFQ